mmetsp:Transcript_8319/g.23663  ORF Transcript_8319/g.23663 Transcript_8319/m.23663 type:complete len:229 (+) Transcript_8319:229-915(+)
MPFPLSFPTRLCHLLPVHHMQHLQIISHELYRHAQITMAKARKRIGAGVVLTAAAHVGSQLFTAMAQPQIPTDPHLSVRHDTTHQTETEGNPSNHLTESGGRHSQRVRCPHGSRKPAHRHTQAAPDNTYPSHSQMPLTQYTKSFSHRPPTSVQRRVCVDVSLCAPLCHRPATLKHQRPSKPDAFALPAMIGDANKGRTHTRRLSLSLSLSLSRSGRSTCVCVSGCLSV